MIWILGYLAIGLVQGVCLMVQDWYTGLDISVCYILQMAVFGALLWPLFTLAILLHALEEDAVVIRGRKP